MKKTFLILLKGVWAIFRFALGIIGLLMLQILGPYSIMLGLYTKTIHKGPLCIPFERLYWLGLDLNQEWKSTRK